jgi:hypothetical protein
MHSFAAVLLGAALAVAAAGTADAASRYNRHVQIHNNASVTMNEFYASNVDTDNYEENILHGDVIRSGETWDINIDDGTGYCKFDFLAVFVDGSEAKKDDVNVCTVSDFYFDD